MNYRADLINWRIKQLGKTYRELSGKKLSTGLLSGLCTGDANPTSDTLALVAKKLGLNRKFLIDPDLKQKDFHRAVVVNGGKR